MGRAVPWFGNHINQTNHAQYSFSTLQPPSLLDGSSAGELILDLTIRGLHQLIELELAAFLGADWHERTAQNTSAIGQKT